MPFIKPTISELVKRISGDVESRLDSRQTRRSNSYVYSRVLAGASHCLYGFIDFLSRQILPDTAETEYLDRHASIYNITRKQPAKARGTIVVSFTTEYTLIPIGTILQSPEGLKYATTSDVSETAEGYACEIESLEGGSRFNLQAGEVLRFIAPIAGVKSDTTALTEITGGADTESDDALRERLLQRIRRTPMAGTEDDYARWALEVEGVTRAWVYPKLRGDGTVDVRVVNDNTQEILPTAELVARVQTHLDAVRPVTALTFVSAPDIQKVNIQILDLVPDSPALRARVEAELRALFKREAHPGQKVLISHINATISETVGEEDHKLFYPLTDLEPETPSTLLVLDSVEFVEYE